MGLFTLEIACFSVEAALEAYMAGANRIELCENPTDGGTTPSYGSLKLAIQKIGIPVFPIIRPRGGDFLYSNLEFEIIKQDIAVCKLLGFSGVVIGLLNQDGTIDELRTKTLVEMAKPMAVTFHRAFDRCVNPLDALEAVINAGCKRLLTSAQMPNVNDNPLLIKQLIQKAGNRMVIMPGSGIRAANILELAQNTGAIEFHSSARTAVASTMHYKVESMQEELFHEGVDKLEIIKMKSNLAQYFEAI